jgi:type IV secretion system protein VirB5
VTFLKRQPITGTGFSPHYHAQRRDYSERYGIHAQNATRWMFVSFGCIAIALLAVGGLIYAALQSKYIPYIVERDNLGDAVAIGLAERAGQPDRRVIQTEIQRWLYAVRTVSTDAETEKHFIFEAYNHTNKSSACAGELNEWFSKNSPFKRAAEEIVTITITSVLPADPANWKTWRANWKEETRTRAGELSSSALKELSMTVSFNPPTSEKDFRKNPTGVFCDNFDWLN